MHGGASVVLEAQAAAGLQEKLHHIIVSTPDR